MMVASQVPAQFNPCGPAGPCGPGAPLRPVLPCGPVGPAGPVAPAGPVGPCGPVDTRITSAYAGWLVEVDSLLSSATTVSRFAADALICTPKLGAVPVTHDCIRDVMSMVT